MSKPDNELIQDFLNNRCTAEDAEQIARYLEQNPEVLNQYLKDTDWRNFLGTKPLPRVTSNRLYANIKKNLRDQKSSILKLKYWSIAASILLILGTGIWLAQTGQTHDIQPIAQTAQIQTKTKINTTVVKNTTKHILKINLPDGSVVDLLNNSQISYEKPFKGKFRDIHLNGEAVFYVAKDKTRPFTVYAGHLATTALGTSFRIVAYPKALHAKVHLMTGKVVINPDQQLSLKGVKKVFLTPGKQFIVNLNTYTARVSSFEVPTKTILADLGTAVVTDSLISFKKRQLPLVLDEISRQYKVKIQYSRNNLSHQYFTGQFRQSTDAADDAIGTIALLNKLKIVKRDSTYFLNK